MIDSYTVRLEKVFHGPMDLLLHLVREQEVEIHEIEISSVIEGFLAYLGGVKDLDIEIAGDFVVMAATLMSIKSRSLLPREEIDLEKELDPRDELIQRLIEYRRFHDAAANLGGLADLRARAFARGSAGSEGEDREEPVLELGDLTAWDLLAQFSRLLRETQAGRPHHVAADGKPLRFYVDELAKRIRELGEVSLRSLLAHFEPERSREALVGSFCAVLELVKLGLVTVEQEGPKSDLVLRLRPEHASDIESVLRASLFDDEIAEPNGALPAAPALSGTIPEEATGTPSEAGSAPADVQDQPPFDSA
jgi:segregation and condensation protein A